MRIATRPCRLDPAQPPVPPVALGRVEGRPLEGIGDTLRIEGHVSHADGRGSLSGRAPGRGDDECDRLTR